MGYFIYSANLFLYGNYTDDTTLNLQVGGNPDPIHLELQRVRNSNQWYSCEEHVYTHTHTHFKMTENNIEIPARGGLQGVTGGKKRGTYIILSIIKI